MRLHPQEADQAVHNRIGNYNLDAPTHARLVPRERDFETGLGSRTALEQFQMDTAMWYGTLTQTSFRGLTDFPSEIIDLLKRLFLTIQRAGLFLRTETGGWGPWNNHAGRNTPPLASALSHGSRVLIQVRDSGFWNWLWTGNPNQMIPPEPNRFLNVLGYKGFYRAGATHGIQPLKESKRQRFRYPPREGMRFVKYTKEVKGMGKAMDLRFNHYGINLPVGGNGNVNPFSGQTIYANGQHGHLYLCYLPPGRRNPGGILVGCEDSAPIDVWNPVAYKKHYKVDFLALKDFKEEGPYGQIKEWEPIETTLFKGSEIPGYPYPELHSGWCRGQTGHAHKMGSSGRFSCTGGKKWKDTTWRDRNIGPCKRSRRKVKVDDTMFIDLITNLDIYEKLVSMNAGDFSPHTIGMDVNPPPQQPQELDTYGIVSAPLAPRVRPRGILPDLERKEEIVPRPPPPRGPIVRRPPPPRAARKGPVFQEKKDDDDD